MSNNYFVSSSHHNHIYKFIIKYLKIIRATIYDYQKNNWVKSYSFFNYYFSNRGFVMNSQRNNNKKISSFAFSF